MIDPCLSEVNNHVTAFLITINNVLQGWSKLNLRPFQPTHVVTRGQPGARGDHAGDPWSTVWTILQRVTVADGHDPHQNVL